MTTRERAHREAKRADISAIAARLQEILGQRITAYAVGIKDPRSIGRYARGGTMQSGTEQRLRNLYEVTQVLVTRETAETVRAWMVGSHPLLDDRAPVELLHEDKRPPVQRTADTDSGASPIEPRTGFQSVVTLAADFVQAA